MSLTLGDTRPDCCATEGNLEVYEEVFRARREAPMGPVQIFRERVVKKCRVCGRRHFELTVDPGVYDFRGKGV